MDLVPFCPSRGRTSNLWALGDLHVQQRYDENPALSLRAQTLMNVAVKPRYFVFTEFSVTCFHLRRRLTRVGLLAIIDNPR